MDKHDYTKLVETLVFVRNLKNTNKKLNCSRASVIFMNSVYYKKYFK